MDADVEVEDRDSAIRRKYLASCQKKRLLRFVLSHPELANNNVPRSQQSDHTRLWQELTEELNSLPGPQKTWKEWRKTWQDIFRKKSPKINKFIRRGEKSTQTDQESSLHQNQVTVVVERADDDDDCLDKKIKREKVNKRDSTDSFFADMDETGDSETYSENVKNTRSKSKSYDCKPRFSIDSGDNMAESITVFPETYVESFSNNHTKSFETNSTMINGHGDSCSLNCEKMTELDQQKVDMKKDYYDFKKDYLRQKLELMKQQTVALKTIAEALSNRPTEQPNSSMNALSMYPK